MSAEKLTSEPLIRSDQLGWSIDRINRLILPIQDQLLAGQRFGETQSEAKGIGRERDGHRLYTPGGDARNIDWRMAAQMPDEPLRERLYIRDITPDLWLATDVGQARNRITPGKEFMEQELALSAVMAMLLLAEKEEMDSSAIGINDHDKFVGNDPELGDDHIFGIGKQLLKLAEADPQWEERGEATQHLSGLLKRLGGLAEKNLVVIVSDFRDAAPDDSENGWEKPLKQLKSLGNDIIAIEPTNLWDFSMYTVERPRFGHGKDAWLGYSKKDKAVRENYEEVVAPEQQAAIGKALKRVDAAHIKLSTGEPRWLTSLSKQLKGLGRKARKAA